MNLISISKASKEIGDRTLYQDLNLGIDDSDKIGLIGVNGCGKTTFVNILAGIDQFDQGQFVTNNDLSLGYLPQKTKVIEGQNVLDFIYSSENERMKVLHDYAQVQLDIQEARDEKNSGTRLEILEERMIELNVYALESEAKQILFHLGITNLNQMMSELSGGMIKKVALARTLIEDNNMLILDEPTNHLDIMAIAWLEEYLMKSRRAMVLITHDRYFLDNVTQVILEIDNKGIRKYKGNFTQFLSKKAELEEIEGRTIHKQNRLLKKELEWLSRMPKARGTKQKARIDSALEIQSELASKEKKQEMGRLFSQQERLGKKILEVKGISKSYSGKPVIQKFTYEFKKGERIAVIGENGVGKTTLLRMIMDDLEPDTGKVIYGVNTKIAYLDQQVYPLDQDLNVIEAVREVANYIEGEKGGKISAKQLLERFMFTSDKHYQKISSLSGGERRRLDIIRILMSNPNFLILDEPTNDLDLQTLGILEEYLLNFEGCLLLVSHDRYFLDKISDSLFILEHDKPILHRIGICSDYIFSLKNKNKKKPNSTIDPQKETKKSIETTKKKTKLSYKEGIRKKEIESNIPQIENEVKILEESLASGSTDVVQIQQWSEAYNQKEEELFSLLRELEEINTGIS